MAIQPDGKIVIAGTAPRMYVIPSGIALYRFNPDGSPDCTFGSEGAVFSNPAGDGRDLGAAAVAIQVDGKIVVAGTVRTEDIGDDFVLVRYASDGSLDPDFASGGIVTTDLGGGNDWAQTMALQSDGKIIVGGRTTGGEFPDDLALVRYNRDGSLDSTFGHGGKVVTPMNRHGSARAIVVQADGKIVVAGSGNSGVKMFNFALLRYNPDGSLDASFGDGGIVLTGLGRDYDGANALAIQADGKMVVGGQSSIVPGRSTLALLRYNANGSLDPTFGNGGKAIYEFTDSDAAAGVAIQADGKIVVVGNMFQPIPAAGFLVVRYNGDGSLDFTFGNGGKVITAVGVHDTVSALVTQADGKMVVGGFTDARSSTSGAANCLVPNCINLTSLLLLRYLP